MRVATGTWGASARNSSPSRRVRLATERTKRSPHRMLVRERGDVAHVDAGADHRPARPSARSAAGTSAPTGAKMIAASSGSGGGSSEPPAQTAPSSRANACAAVVAGAGEREHLPALPARDLGDDVGGGAEAVEAEPPRLARHAQRAVADQPGAQQRRAPARRGSAAGIGKQKRSSATVYSA